MTKLTTSLALAALALTIGITSANAAIVGSRRTAAETSSTDCSADMGFLFDVRPAQIRNLDGQRVYIQPVCEDTSIAVNANAVHIDGNVTGLHRTIGQSELLVSALYDRHYDADDVVGIRVNRNSDQVILYVHKNGR